MRILRFVALLLFGLGFGFALGEASYSLAILFCVLCVLTMWMDE